VGSASEFDDGIFRTEKRETKIQKHKGLKVHPPFACHVIVLLRGGETRRSPQKKDRDNAGLEVGNKTRRSGRGKHLHSYTR